MGNAEPRIVLCCVGTRPEAVKMAPVILALRETLWAKTHVLLTGQHRKMLDDALAFFDVQPDSDLDVMSDGQSLAELTSRLLVKLDEALQGLRPDLVIAEGDTTTVLAVALACFYRRVPFAHVEAGLRTHNLSEPFPEEANRLVATHLASLHFAPTPTAKENLLNENVPADAIHVVGNPVIDALRIAEAKNVPPGIDLDDRNRMILVTAHRRENFGEPLRNICRAVDEIARRRDDVEFVWPVHPNPSVKPVVQEMLAGRPRVHLCEPMEYGRFVSVMKRALIILTDSGGLQEEAPALHTPVLVMREISERPEAIRSGAARLVGTETRRIVDGIIRLLDDPAACASMSSGGCPYGDGAAAGRIVRAVGRFLDVTENA